MAKSKVTEYPTDEVYLRDIEVAARIGIAVPTVWRWSRTGRLPEPIRFSAGCVRFRLSELLCFEEGRAGTANEVTAEAAAIRQERMDSMRRERSARWRRQKQRRQDK